MFAQQFTALSLGIEREFEFAITPTARHIPDVVGLRITSMTTLAVQTWGDGTALIEPRHLVAGSLEQEADLLLGARLDESGMLTLIGDNPMRDVELIRWRIMALLNDSRGGPRTLHRGLTPAFTQKVTGLKRFWPVPVSPVPREQALLACTDNLIRYAVSTTDDLLGRQPLERLLTQLVVGTEHDPKTRFIAEFAAQARDGLAAADILHA